MNEVNNLSKGWVWLSTRPIVDVCLSFTVVWTVAAAVSGFDIFADAVRVFRAAYWGGWSTWQLILNWLTLDLSIILACAVGVSFLRRSVRRIVSICFFSLLLVSHYQADPPSLFTQGIGIDFFGGKSWVSLLFQILPYFVISYVGLLAFRNLFFVRNLRDEFLNRDLFVAEISPRRSKRLSAMSLVLVIMAIATLGRHLWNQSQGPNPGIESKFSAQSLVFVTYGISLSHFRAAIFHESRQSEWLRSAHRIVLHQPTLQLRRPMSSELILGRAVGGPNSNWDIRWAESEAPQSVLSFRSAVERSWFWGESLPESLQGYEFVMRTRSALNPIFSALITDLDGTERVSQTGFQRPFTVLEKKLLERDTSQFIQSSPLLILDLPSFPFSSSREQGELYWEMLRGFVRRIVESERFPHLEKVVWIGLPSEHLANGDEGPEEVSTLMNMVTSVALEWTNLQPSTFDSEALDGVSLERSHINVRGSPVYPTSCLRNMLWEPNVINSSKIGRCGEASPLAARLAIFETNSVAIISQSQIQNFLSLVSREKRTQSTESGRVFLVGPTLNDRSEIKFRKLKRDPTELDISLLATAGFTWLNVGSGGAILRTPMLERPK